MDKKELAGNYFMEGYNCAQSTALPFCQEAGLDEETMARLTSSFGGGMGRLREVCGAVSAMFMIAGLDRGYEKPGDDEIKGAHYELIQEMAAKFKEEYGTIICRELLGLPEGPDDPVPSKRTAAYYDHRQCEKYVRKAASIIEEMLAK